MVFEDPTAGAALVPSVPICSRFVGRKVTEFVVDTTDSVGLRGRSGIGEGSARAAKEELDVPRPEAELRYSLDVLAKLREEDEALMVCNLRRRSSNGAPVLL